MWVYVCVYLCMSYVHCVCVSCEVISSPCSPTSAAVVDSGGQYHERMARMEAFTTWLKDVLFAAGEEEVKSLLAQSVRAQKDYR